MCLKCSEEIKSFSFVLKNVISRQNDPSPVFFSFKHPDFCVMLMFDGTAWLLNLWGMLYCIFGYNTCLDLMHLYVRACAGATGGSAARPRFHFSERGPMNEAKLKSREACVYFWVYIFLSFFARKLSLSCVAVKTYQEPSMWLHSSLTWGGIGCPDAVCVASGAGGESRGGMPSDRSLFNPPDTLTVP